MPAEPKLPFNHPSIETAFEAAPRELVAEIVNGQLHPSPGPVYARELVGWVWLVEPVARVLEVHRLDPGAFRLLATRRDDTPVRAEPFDAIALDRARGSGV